MCLCNENILAEIDRDFVKGITEKLHVLVQELCICTAYEECSREQKLGETTQHHTSAKRDVPTHEAHASDVSRSGFLSVQSLLIIRSKTLHDNVFDSYCDAKAESPPDKIN